MLIEVLDTALERTAADLSAAPPDLLGEKAFEERPTAQLVAATGASWTVRRPLGVSVEHWPRVSPVESPPADRC